MQKSKHFWTLQKGCRPPEDPRTDDPRKSGKSTVLGKYTHTVTRARYGLKKGIDIYDSSDEDDGSEDDLHYAKLIDFGTKVITNRIKVCVLAARLVTIAGDNLDRFVRDNGESLVRYKDPHSQ